MNIIKKIPATLLIGLSLISSFAIAGVEEDVSTLQKEWEKIKYQSSESSHEKSFESLIKEATKLVEQNPNRAETLIWQGIIESSYAGAKGGLGALAHVKNAKKSLEKAIELNAMALDGSAYTSLGSLYYQVPSWPIGFGDDKKAAEYLKKGLDINPDGIDPNYFYADFLFRNGDYSGAEKSLRKALQAPARNGRKVADDGRRKEINQLLEKVAEKRK
uniref:tetratricopeptide repeat protein n=1 Tax=Polynucleobacter sp. TaxID=2029855 RepID=UPI004047E4CA